MARYCVISTTEVRISDEDTAKVVEVDGLETVLDIASDIAAGGTFAAILYYVRTSGDTGDLTWVTADEVEDDMVVQFLIQVQMEEHAYSGHRRLNM